MNRVRYPWWSYVKQIIRDYPDNRKRFESEKIQTLVPSYSGMAVAHRDISRTTENLALRELPTTKQREFEAVRLACETMQKKANGELIIKLIDLVFWKQSHTIAGAAMKVHVSYATAKRWHKAFIIMVGRNYGFLDVEGSE